MQRPFLLAVAATALFASFGTAQYFYAGTYSGGNNVAYGGSGSTNWAYPTVAARGASFNRDLGNTDAGIQLRSNARVEKLAALINSTTQARRLGASGSMSGRVWLWGQSLEGVGLSALARVQNGDWSTSYNYIDRSSFRLRGHYDASFSLRLGGVTRFSRDYTGETDVVRQVRESFDLPTIFQKDHTFWVYGVPVTVEVKVGAQASLSLDATLRPVNLSAGLGGNANGHAFGRASAGLGFGCLQVAGVTFDLRLLDTTLGLDLLASDIVGLRGTLDYRMTAVRILLKVFGRYCFWSWSRTLWDRSFGSVSGTKNLI